MKAVMMILSLVVGSQMSFAGVNQVQVCKVKVTKADMLDTLKEIDITLSRGTNGPTDEDQKNCAIFAHGQGLFVRDQINEKVDVTFKIESRNFMRIE